MSISEIILNFFIYSFCGWSTEVAYAAIKHRKFVNRGFLNGPICPVYGICVVAVILILQGHNNSLLKLYCMSVVVASAIEWIAGVVLEKLFHHRWWDYSGLPMNIQGFVCLPFSLAWGVACVVVVKYLHPLVLRLMGFIPAYMSCIIIAILVSLLAADIYVTVHEILKLNVKLEKMQAIADDMERLSVHLGENLSRGIIKSAEKHEDVREKMDCAKEKLEEMYMAQIEGLSYTNRRLLRAFPKMQSDKYKVQLQRLKTHLEDKKKGK